MISKEEIVKLIERWSIPYSPFVDITVEDNYREMDELVKKLTIDDWDAIIGVYDELKTLDLDSDNFVYYDSILRRFYIKYEKKIFLFLTNNINNNATPAFIYFITSIINHEQRKEIIAMLDYNALSIAQKGVLLTVIDDMLNEINYKTEYVQNIIKSETNEELLNRIDGLLKEDSYEDL